MVQDPKAESMKDAGKTATEISGSSPGRTASDLTLQSGTPSLKTLPSTETHIRSLWGTPRTTESLDPTLEKYFKAKRCQRRTSVPAVDRELTFPLVVEEERVAIDVKKQSLESAQVKMGKPFSIAFSGGGIRAAAFQSGVLWRLAEIGVLQDVEYLASVSGGAYICASFASHLYGMDFPERDTSKTATEQVNSHFLAVVAKSICRMQENAGNFIRDPKYAGKSPGSGFLPPICDFPIFLALLILTLIVNPLQITVVYLVPATEIIELLFGTGLRAGFCAPDFWIDILRERSPFGNLIYVIMILFAITLVVWLVDKVLHGIDVSKAEDTPRLPYLFMHGLKHCLMRGSLSFLAVCFLLLIVGYTENLAFTNSERLLYCQNYIRTESSTRSNCGDTYQDKRWYSDKCYQYLLDFNASEKCDQRSALPCAEFVRSWQLNDCCYTDSCQNTIRAPSTIYESWLQLQEPRRLLQFNGVPGPTSLIESATPLRVSSVLNFCVSVISLALGASFVFAPFIPAFFVTMLMVFVPLVYLIFMLVFVQYRIYGVVTGEKPGNLGLNRETWETWVTICVCSQIVCVILFNEFQRIWHKYYSRSLQKSFFYNGQDVPFVCLSYDGTESDDADEELCICPYMLVTGTVSDYKPNHSNKPITELSFSPLHCGSIRTGYSKQPDFRTLAKVTALTGAGCLDAISLSMSNRLRFRILLQVLNLSWGDFILFNLVPDGLFQRFAHKFPRRSRGVVMSHLHQGPVTIVWIFFILVLLYALKMTHRGKAGEEACRNAKTIVWTVVMIGIAAFLLSFFSFMPGLDVLLYSPLIRQFHQFTRFYIRGSKTPGMLYVTDGGVQDCTGLVQLCMRRCEHILLVLAAADPDDKLEVLRTAMEAVRRRKLGSWFDPGDPRRDINITLEEFASDINRTTLRLNVLYGWTSDLEDPLATPPAVIEAKTTHSTNIPSVDGARVGKILIVKNRLPKDAKIGRVSCQPLLTEEEICGHFQHEEGAVDHPTYSTMTAADLGGLGCCDCCHTHCGCNCGGKFPHLTGANYLWLTPRLFSSLCRLGYELSEEAAEEILSLSAEGENSPTDQVSGREKELVSPVTGREKELVSI